MSLNVRVITPDQTVWDAPADEVILPSSTGQVGILSDHAPLLTALDIGVMRLKTDGNWASIVLMEGFAEVEDNKVTILCNGAEEGSSIDPKTAQEELEKNTLLVYFYSDYPESFLNLYTSINNLNLLEPKEIYSILVVNSINHIFC